MALKQGDLGLLDSPVAKELLNSTIPARLAYVGPDGGPRVVPVWFHWNGEELVFGSWPSTEKARSLTSNPAAAVTIDTEGSPTHTLMLRGQVTIEDANGVPKEYALAAKRYLGDEDGAGWVAGIEERGEKMVRIAFRPTWAAVLDFETRLPSFLGGVTG